MPDLIIASPTQKIHIKFGDNTFMVENRITFKKQELSIANPLIILQKVTCNDFDILSSVDFRIITIFSLHGF